MNTMSASANRFTSQPTDSVIADTTHETLIGCDDEMLHNPEKIREAICPSIKPKGKLKAFDLEAWANANIPLTPFDLGAHRKANPLPATAEPAPQKPRKGSGGSRGGKRDREARYAASALDKE